MTQEELNTLSQEWAGSIYPPAAYQAGFRKALELVREVVLSGEYSAQSIYGPSIEAQVVDTVDLKTLYQDLIK